MAVRQLLGQGKRQGRAEWKRESAKKDAKARNSF
jgi:hypothetical protein